MSEQGCGIGVVSRDDKGSVIFVGARSIQAGSGVKIIEAEAIRWALELACSLGPQRIMITSDSSSLVNKLRCALLPRTVLGVILAQVLALHWEMEECNWTYVLRDTNKVAHFLDRLCPTSPLTWMSDFSFLLEFYDILSNGLISL